jgi:hypothetical protein
MAVPVLLYVTETWTLKKRVWNILEGAEMKYQRMVRGYTRTAELRDELIGNELVIFPSCKEIRT